MIRFTLFTDDAGERAGNLAKHISLTKDGRLRKDQPAPLAAGVAESRALPLNGWEGALAELLRRIRSHEALGLGVLVHRLAQGLGRSAIRTQRHAQPPASFARTRENFGFLPGKPALLLLDFDSDAMPAEIAMRLDSFALLRVASAEQRARAGVMAAVAEACPAFASVGLVRRPSTSAGIRRHDGRPIEGVGLDGAHVYVAVDDGADIARIVDALRVRLTLAGFGWTKLSRDGRLLHRTVIDVFVGAPERIIYESLPVLSPELQRDHAACEPLAATGPLLRAADVPPLTEEERQRCEAWEAAECLRLQADAKVARAAYDQAEIVALTARGVPVERAEAAVAARHLGELTSATVIAFSDGKHATVAEMLTDPKGYDGQYAADPHEPEAGLTRAYVATNCAPGDDRLPIIFSHLHGGAIFRLRIDAKHLQEAVDARLAADDARGAKAWLAANGRLLSERIDESTVQAVLRRIARALRVPVADLRSELSQALDGRFGDDGRPVLRVDEGRRAEALELLAEAARASGLWFRQGRGAERRVVLVLGDAVHAARASDVCSFTDNAFAVRRYATSSKRQIRSDFKTDWARAFLEAGALDLLPVLRGVAHVPVLRPDGTIVEQPGYDAASGFWIASGLTLPPSPTTPGAAEPRAALSVLRDLLRTYAFAGERDRIAGVAFILTAVLRPALRLVPILVADSVAPRTGKGHLLRTVSLVATGDMPVFFPMAGEPEKRIAAALLSGEPFIVLDNINGPLSSEDLCVIVSEGEAGVRAYGTTGGVQRAVHGGIISVSGNNIRLADDLASRGAICRQDAGLHPGSRIFTFDPHAEARTRRGEFVTAALTLGRWALTLGQPDGLRGANGFPDWDKLVRTPLFILTGIDVLDATFERQAEEVAFDGRAAEVDGVGELMGEEDFTAAQLHARLRAVPMLSEALSELAALNAKQLGFALLRLRDVPGEQFRLLKVGRGLDQSRANTYRCERIGPAWLS